MMQTTLPVVADHQATLLGEGLGLVVLLQGKVLTEGACIDGSSFFEV